MKKITLIGALFLSSFLTYAQTTLSAGDIAFLGINTDGTTDADDSFAFVLLKDIDATTEIIFTDRGWNDDTGFSSFIGDGEFTWTSGSARTAGEVVVLSFDNLLPAAASFSVLGDQLFAIQGSIASPTFIAGLQYNDTLTSDDANWDGTATTNQTSALPDALTTGDTAVRLVPEQDNWQFSCSIATCPLSGSPSQLRAILHNGSNWNSDNNTVFPTTVDSSFGTPTVGPEDITPPVITLVGDDPLELAEGDTYADPGATALDDIDGDITANIVVGGDTVDTNTPGSYTVTYNVMDAAGNPATEVTRVVNVSAVSLVTGLISEFQPNPIGSDPANQTFELSGTPGEMFSGWLISIESDAGSSAGIVDRATAVSGTFDSEGLLTVTVPDLENPSFTVALLSNFTGTEGITDIDTDNDGTPDDLSTFGTVLDAIGIPDVTGEPLYGAALGGTDFAFTGDEPRLIFRDASIGDWYAINDPDSGQVFDISGTDVTPAIFDTDPTVGTDTFGTINPTAGAPVPILISEFQPNPIGSDPADQTFELSGPSGGMFSGWLISIESDAGGSAGTVDRATAVSGTFNSEGVLTVTVPDLENPSFTVALLSDFTGTAGSTDIDTDNDGTPDDLSTFGTVLDAIGIPDVAGEPLYGTALGGTDFAFTGDEPRLVFRDASVGDWYAINDPDGGEVFDISGTDVTPGIFNIDPTSGTDTFGTINPSVGGAIPNVISIVATDAIKAEGNSGTTDFTFTVSRTGDTTGATTVDYTLSGDVDAADFGGTLPSGTINFATDDIEEILTLSVSGDMDSELDETFTVSLTNPGNGETLNPLSAEGIIQDDDSTVVPALISAIQGSGSSSPEVGNIVTIEGIVTGDFQDGDADTARNLRGFYVQEEIEDSDGNPDTSEGIFVFDASTSTNPPTVDVNVGDKVLVTGTVVEFNGETQIGSVTSILINGTGTISPVSVPLPFANTFTNADGELIADLERYEGMLVGFDATLTVAEYFNYDRYGEIRLFNGNRSFQFTQNNAPDATGFGNQQDNLAKNTVVLDDGQSFQNPDPLPYPSSPFSDANSFRGGDTVTNLEGVVRFSRGSGSNGDAIYRIMPTSAPTFTSVNSRPNMPDGVGGSLKVVSFNVLNYFTTLDDGSFMDNGQEPRGANNAAEFDRQTEKLVKAIVDIDADVLGLVEIENDFSTEGTYPAIANLVDEINAVVGPNTYNWVQPPTGATLGDDAIAVGFIYKTVTINLVGNPAALTTAAFLDPNSSGTNRNRAALAQTFEEIATGAVFTATINHFKSKGRSSGTLPPADNDASDGEGFWGDTREKAAQALADWLNSDPTASGDPDFMILGDLNGYAEEPVITTLEAAGFTDLAQANITNPYSFVFDGQLGTLDYALVNTALNGQVTGITEWHINADEPDALDYNTDFNPPALFDGTNPFRNSDHDPVIVGLNLNPSVLPGFDLQITEMWPGNEPGTNLTSDWFEITNEGTVAWVSGVDPDLFYDDDSQDGTVADIINGITDIQPGERVIIIIGTASDVQQFRDIWSPAYDLTGIEIGYTDGSGLGQGGDGVTLFVGGPAMENIVDFETFPNADLNGGQSYDVGLAAFSTEGNASNAGATFAVNDADQPAIGSPGNQGSLAPTAELQITEMWPGNEPGSNLSEDWFEITNTGSAAWESGVDPDLFYDDISQAPGDAAPISGITDIQPGERVIVLVSDAGAAAITEFTNLWSPDYDLTGIEIGIVDGSGLGQGGDGVTLWTGNPNGTSDFFLSDFEIYPNADANGGQSYDVELTAFSLIANASNAAATSTLNDQSQPAIASPGNQGPLSPSIDLQITEIWPGQAGEDVTADWFEIYNAGSQSWVSGTNPDLFYDDESASAADSDLIEGITAIQPGESVIIVIGDASDAATFNGVWSIVYELTDIQIGFTDGAGLGGGGDAVTLWLGDPRGSGLLSDNESYPDTAANDGQSYDVVNGSFSVAGSGAAAPGTNEAVATSTLGGDLGDIPAVGSPGNQGPSTVDPNAPIVLIDVANLTPFLSLPEENSGSVSGVINDPTDPAATLGIPFIISDSDNDITDLNVAIESGAPVDPLVAITPAFDPAISEYVLTITPSSVGFNTIAIIATDSNANQGNYLIEYASSAASVEAATSRFHTGAADGSTAIPTGGDFMWVGDDEDQTLRLYDCNNSGLPLTEIDFNGDLGSTGEIDIEGSFQSGNTLYWIGSTANATRSVLFSTTISGAGAASTLSFVDQYTGLRDDLLNGGFGLPTNIEIEALALAPGSTTTAYLGFRVPDNSGDALVIPVTNFTALPGMASGSAAFGTPINLDLGGRTLRSMECNSNGCILIGGPNGTVNDFALFTWSGNAMDVPEFRGADLTALTTGGSFEGIVGLPAGTFLGSAGDALSVKLLTDLGATTIYEDGVENKDQRRAWRKFRSDIVVLGPVTDPPVVVPNIVINEILFDPAGDLTGDANGDGVREASGDEFVEILNLDGTNVDISGWTLSDDDGGNPFVFPGGTLLVNNCTAVLFGGGTPTGDFGQGLVFTDDGTIGTGLGNSGDLIELRDDEGNLVASYEYGTEGVGDESLTRDPDGTGSEPLVAHSAATGSGGALFSPGTQVDGSSFSGCDPVSLPVLQITEIWPGNEPGANLTEDWFEITNTGDIPWTAAEFGNLFFDDESQAASDAVIINGITEIQPGEVVIAIDDTDTAQFLSVWSSYNLTGIQIGTYQGAGLSQSGDGVTLWIGDPQTTGTLADFENYPDANTNGGQSYDVELAAFSTVGNANNAAATDEVNDADQPAIGSPGNQGPIAAVALIITPSSISETLQVGQQTMVNYVVDSEDGSLLPTPAAISIIDDATGMDATWASTTSAANQGVTYEVFLDATGLAPGTFTATLTAGPVSGFMSASIPITLVVQPDELSVTSYNLINADTGGVIQTLIDGMVLDVNTLPTMNLNIEAVTTNDVESVEMVLSGAQSNTRVENVAPYALFGDISGIFNGNMFVVGSYSLTSTPYSGNRLGGTMGTGLTINFTIIDDPVCATFDAFVATESGPTTCGGNDGMIMVTETGATAPVSYELLETGTVQSNGTFTDLSAGSYNIQVTDSNGCTETVMVTLSDPDLPEVTLAPFANVQDTDAAFPLTGGSPAGGTYSGPGVSGGMFDPGVTGVGTFQIVYTFTDLTTNCENSAVQSITVGSSAVNAITGFVLVDADLDRDIGPITDGQTFVLSDLPSTNLNIRANATSDVESVLLQLTGSLTNTRTENVAPYALYGDINEDYNAQVFGPGDYAVTATPYTGNRLRGDMGTSLTVNFSIVVPPEAPQPNAMRLYPNPASDAVHMEFEQTTTVVSFQVFDIMGRLVKEVKAVQRNGEYQMPVFDLPVGNYFVKTVDIQGAQFTEQMVIER